MHSCTRRCTPSLTFICVKQHAQDFLGGNQHQNVIDFDTGVAIPGPGANVCSCLPYSLLMQDSLGGNTKTVMIANFGPADWNYDETLSSLK